MLLTTVSTQAQTIQNSGTVDLQLSFTSPSSFSSVSHINCDAYDCPVIGAILYAIAWDDAGTGDAYVKVMGAGGGSDEITISGARNPDIVIGETGTGGNNYHIAVVYEKAGDVYYELHDINFSGSNVSSVTQVGSAKKMNTNTAGSPRIDMFCDDVNVVGSFPNDFPTLHEFVITYHEDNGGTNEVKRINDDMSTAPASLSASILVDADGNYPDVSVFTDIGTGDKHACFVYSTNYVGGTGQDLKVKDINLTSPGTTITPLASGVDVYEPRIESVNMINLGSGSPKAWNAVATIASVSGTNYNTYSYMPGLSAYVFTSIFSNSYTYRGTVVAGGIGSPNVSGPPGNFMKDAYADFFNPLYSSANYIAAGPAGSSLNTNPFYEVTNTGTMGISSPTVPALAVSSISNSGREVFAAWYNGTDIYYKCSQNFPNPGAFKPTSINKVDNSDISIYPNPASDKLVVKGSKGGYTVTDITGRSLISGNAANAVDISRLTPGLYILNVSENGSSTRIKFTKE